MKFCGSRLLVCSLFNICGVLIIIVGVLIVWYCGFIVDSLISDLLRLLCSRCRLFWCLNGLLMLCIILLLVLCFRFGRQISWLLCSCGLCVQLVMLLCVMLIRLLCIRFVLISLLNMKVGLLVVVKWFMLVLLFGQIWVSSGISCDSLLKLFQVSMMLVVCVIVIQWMVWLVELLVVISVMIVLMIVCLLMIWFSGWKLLFSVVMFSVCLVVLWVRVLCSGVFGLMNEVFGNCMFMVFSSIWLELVVLQKVQVFVLWYDVDLVFSSFLWVVLLVVQCLCILVFCLFGMFGVIGLVGMNIVGRWLKVSVLISRFGMILLYMLRQMVVLNMLWLRLMVVVWVMILCENSDSFMLLWFWVILLYIVGMLLVICVVVFSLWVMSWICLGQVLNGWCVDSMLLQVVMMFRFGVMLLCRWFLLVLLQVVNLWVRLL